MPESIHDIVLCPGCGMRLPVRNNGTCSCGWENPDGRIWRVGEYLTKKCSLNDVCALFLRRIHYGEIPQMGK